MDRELRDTMADANVTDTLIDATGATASACASTCTPDLGAGNHGHWPDGIWDGGGIDRELDMLAFMRDHPLR